MTLDIVVYGHPAPQGSKRHVGKGIMVESSKHVKPWREDVRQAALTAISHWVIQDAHAPKAGYPLDGPLVARMVFSLERPRGHYRTGRNAHLLRDAAPPRPIGYPDTSKLLRSTEDALKSAGAIRDDSLIVEYSRAAKVYVGEDPEALDRPGVRIRIEAAGYLAKEGS